MRDDYHQVAKIYDLLLSSTLRKLKQDIRTYIIHKNYRRVVDICCGTGQQLQILDREGMNLCGIDNSLVMLEQARRNCSDRIELHLLDAEQCSFAENSYDCVILSLALHEKHQATADTIFTKCHALLREQGSLIIADFNPPNPGIPGAFIGKCIIPVIERCAGTIHYKHYQNWMEGGGLINFLNQRGKAAEIISQPFHGNILCCGVTRNDAVKIEQRNFGLLDLSLKQNISRDLN